MPTHQSVSDIVSDIARTKLPAVVIDTCVTLDLVRCVWRGNTRVVGIAKQFIDAQKNGELLLYAHSVVQKEATRNRVSVEGEAQKKAVVVDEALDHYRRAAQYFGIVYPHAAGHLHGTIVPMLMTLHDQLLATCVHIAPDSIIKDAAFARCSDNLRPSTTGGGANDCLMFEEFRSLAHGVPAADPLVLFTTNPNDFLDKSKGHPVLHTDITSDLGGTKGQLCFDWDLAAKLVLSGYRLKWI